MKKQQKNNKKNPSDQNSAANHPQPQVPGISRPGVSPETIRAEGIHHVDSEVAFSFMGQYTSGAWIPHYHVDGTPVTSPVCRKIKGAYVTGPDQPFGRLRLDAPTDKMKYTQARGAGVHGYIPRCFKVPAEKGGILHIPEGEFKTLSMIEAGYCAVGAGGIQNFAVKGGLSLVPELAEAIDACQPRAIAFVGDADTALIPDFSKAMIKMAKLLGTRPLLLPRLPVNAPGKGIDDCREKLKDQFNAWYDSLVDQAVVVNPSSTPWALALELLGREVDALKTLDGKSAVTRDNALERIVKLAAGFFPEVPAREEILRIANQVFGVPVDQLRTQAEQVRKGNQEKMKADLEKKARMAATASAPVQSAPVGSNGQSGSTGSVNLPEIDNDDELVKDESVTEPPAIVEGLIHLGSKVVLASGSKARKTWILQHLSLCIASGTPFLDRATVKSRVLYINFEIQRAFYKSRMIKLREATGTKECPNLDSWALRGHATHLGKLMPKIIERVKERGYSVIILDPIYKCLGGRDENSAGAISELCNELESLPVQTGAAVVFAAHFTKGNQAGKVAMDRIAGSGVFARDADSIVTLTEHDVPGAFTVEATLRNFPEMGKFVVQWKFPLMVLRPDLNPAKLKVAGRKPTFSTADILALLNAGPLTTTQWLEAAKSQLAISKSTFLRLKKDAVLAVAVVATPADKWELPSSPASPAHGVTSAKTTN